MIRAPPAGESCGATLEANQRQLGTYGGVRR
jgi:hypothetical protein